MAKWRVGNGLLVTCCDRDSFKTSAIVYLHSGWTHVDIKMQDTRGAA